MALIYPPKLGAIVMCDFPECFDKPEMVKKRAVIVVSPRAQNETGLVTIVPLSHTDPDPICAHHCQIPPRLLPKYMQSSGGARWAKCDLLYSFSIARLELIRGGKDKITGKRVYDQPKLDLEHILMIRRCIASALCITSDILEK